MKKIRDPHTGQEIWRLTNDPAVNHTHLYHNIDAFSGDGRYVAYGADLPHFGDENHTARVFVYDLLKGIERGGHLGAYPVWNPCRPDLVFSAEDVLYKWDLESDEIHVLHKAEGIITGSVERHGVWALCYYGWRVRESRLDRVAMDGSGRVETILDGVNYEHLALPKANPAHDVCHVRRYDRDPAMLDLPPDSPPDAFLGLVKPLNMIILGTDGSDPHPVSNREEWHHHNWSGDGEWYMLGPYRKRWNARPEAPWEAWGIMDGLNHQGHCGRDGRFIVGDFGNQYTFLYDLHNKEMHRINAPISASVPYSKLSDPHAIGSPDGTKYVFDSLFNLESAPITHLARTAWPANDILTVESTAGFPKFGSLVAGNVVCGPEIIQYGCKNDTQFLDCKRGSPPAPPPRSLWPKVHAGDTPTTLIAGVAVVPYDAMHLSPGVHREPDVYVQVVRPPEHPRMVRATRHGDSVSVSWRTADNHREIRIYRVWRNPGDGSWANVGEAAHGASDRTDPTDWTDPDPPDGPILYAVTSVEWSGLESERSAGAAVQSRDGTRLPAEVDITVSDADIVAGTSAAADDRLTLCFDDSAYNKRSVAMRNGLGSILIPFSLPMAATAHIAVRSKFASEGCNVLSGRVNQDNFRTHVSTREFDWVAVTVDSSGNEATVSLQEQNEIVLVAPIDRVTVDMIRIRIA
jgi:hypothetical protein